MQRRSVVLVSGGLDSAVALFLALREGDEVLPLTFEYHGRPAREAAALGALLPAAQARGAVLPVRRVALPLLREAADLPAVPEHLRGAPEGYVPGRNLVFYAVAASVAEAEGAARIVGGHNGVDPELFPDSSPAFFADLNALLPRSAWSHTRRPFRVELPIAGRSKDEVVRMGLGLGVPFERTWSCYHDAPKPCGGCGSCVERAEAFAAAGSPDPLLAGAPRG